MDKKRAFSIVNNFSKSKILVIGDIMLDEYIEGTIERISPEAPIPVVNVSNKKADRRLGGAANVFNNLISLGGKDIFLCGIVGDDEHGNIIKDKLRTIGADITGLVTVNGRPTTVKTRIIAHNQQVIRLDKEERAPIARRTSQKVLNYIQEKLNTVDAVIISDYEKGLLTEALLKEVLPEAFKKRIIVAVDPKFSNFKYFKKVTILVPNMKEARAFARHEIETPEDIRAAAHYILKTLECEYVLIKMGERGMTLVDKTGHQVSIETAAVEVYDVTGAGDTVMSALMLAKTAGATWEEAARIANISAGIVVSHVGTSTVELKGLKSRILKNRVASL